MAYSSCLSCGVLGSTQTEPIAITENGELAKPDFSAAPNDFG